MKRILPYLLLIITEMALADVALHIEHPRHPSHQKDVYDVKCGKVCAVQIFSQNPMKGTSGSVDLEKKIRVLMEKAVPSSKERLSKVLYQIEASDGKKKKEFIIGYPRSYEGEEYLKYSQIISLIEELKVKLVEDIKVKE